jgi:sulfate transport system substrate-binding protein
LVGQQAGQDYELVIPRSTLLIENPVALVDEYVDQHGVRPAAEAFVAFLFTPEAQEVFARHGLRSPDAGVAASTASLYPPVPDLFTITDQFGGWSRPPALLRRSGHLHLAIIEVQGMTLRYRAGQPPPGSHGAPGACGPPRSCTWAPWCWS